MSANGVMGSGFALLQLAVQQGLLRLFQLCSTRIERFTPVLSEGVEGLIQDRIKDVIISGGENISSVEVEGVLLEHPAIQEVAVVGLPHETWGEAPHAFCLLQPDTMLDFDELRVFARERLAGFKVPKGMTVLEELPKTATGKIQKYVLRGGGGVHAQ